MCDLPVNGELSETVQSRLHDLADLSGFAERCQHTLTGLLQCLGWSQDFNKDRTQEEPTQLCPCDANHRVPRSSLDEHLLSCRLRHMGYSRQEQDEMYDPSVCYEKARVPSVIMDTELQQQIILQARADAPPERTEGLYSQITGVSIKRKGELDCSPLIQACLFTYSEYSSEPAEVPQNHKHAVCDLTVADRLALYNHVSRETGRQRSQAELAENEDLYVDLAAKLKRDDDQNGPKSHLEVLAEMRDYKRRRQSYRAKNVHITKKSYTEVIREVIDVHSGVLARLWKEEEGLRSAKPSSQRMKSDEKRSASIESRHSLGSSRDVDSSRHRRNHSRERDKDSRRKRESRSPDERHCERKRRK